MVPNYLDILQCLFPLQPTKVWVTWIQHEWKILENDLPGLYMLHDGQFFMYFSVL